MNLQKAELIGDFIKNAFKDSSHIVIANVSADKGIWHVVTHFDGTFYLFFAIDDRPNVNLFTSSDGYVFEEHENNPILSAGKKGAWDDLYIEPHSILRVAKRWRIVYGGRGFSDKGIWRLMPKMLRRRSTLWLSNKLGNVNIWRASIAESEDLISWSKHPENPVFSVPNMHVADPRVVHFKDKFWMYYLSSKSGIYLATSDDGISWENSQINPVFDKGALAAFIPLEDVLIAFYRSSSTTNIAFSDDGVHWIDFAKNPVLSPNIMSYDCKRIVWPYAVQVDEELYLYYQIVDSKGKWKLAVTSINLKNVLNKV